MGFDDNKNISHLPNHRWHHFTSKEHAQHGESLREQETHDGEHQHQPAVQIWHTEGQLIHFLYKQGHC